MFMTLLLAAIIAYVFIGLLFVGSAVVMAGRSPHPRPVPVHGSLDEPPPHLSRLLVAHRVLVAVQDHHHFSLPGVQDDLVQSSISTTSPRTR